MTVTVVSACYGGYDAPAVPLEQDVDVRWVMVNDGTVEVPAPWKSVVEYRSHLHPRMAAKIPKCLPYRYSGGVGPVIWLDASATIRRHDFVSECVAVLGDGDVAQWVHPQRDCIVPEADVSATMGKYTGQPVQDQVAHYVKRGHPLNSGLWATGCMVWRRDGRAWHAGRSWLIEQNKWTYQDQLSWPVVVRAHELDVRPMPGSLWDQQRLTFRPHASDA
jgi:hypothetical protein